MAHDGSLALPDVRGPTLAIVRASRAARAVQRGGLITGHGADMRQPDLLATLANCENAGAFSIYDRCKAWYVHRPGGVQRVMARLQSPLRLTAGASPVV